MKKILCGTLVLILSCNSFASNINPEVTRNKKSPSDSALGLSWSKRNTAGVSFLTSSTDTEVKEVKTKEVTLSGIAPYVFYHYDFFSTEFFYNKSTSESKPVNSTKTESDITLPSLKTAFRVSDMFAIVASYDKTDLDIKTTAEATDKGFSLGVSFKPTANLVTGIEIQKRTYKVEYYSNSKTYDVDYNTLNLGLGYESKEGENVYSIEAALKITPEKKGDVKSGAFVYQEKVNELNVQGTIIKNEWQYDGEAFFNKTEDNYDTTKSETSAFSMSHSLEYLVTPNFYLLPTLTSSYTTKTIFSVSSREIKTRETKLDFEAGYRTTALDLSAGFGLGGSTAEENNKDDTEGYLTSFNINLAYFF